MEISLNDKFINNVSHKKLLVAVSGGVDSMVLLDLLTKAQKQAGFSLHVIHVNHNLRGDASNLDEKLVKSVCKTLGVTCHVVSVDVLGYKEKNKLTMEESARKLRYEAINRLKNEINCDYVVLAHNADDQAETILMNICRGAGAYGGTGIKESNELLRPLLDVSKNDIYAYAAQNKIAFREDLSNKDIEITRNNIRNLILPALEQIYPSAKKNLIKFAKLLSEDLNYIENQVDYSVIQETTNGDICIKKSIFELDKVILSRIVKRCIQKLGVYHDIEQKHYEMLYNISDVRNNGRICLPHGVNVVINNNYVIFTLKNVEKIQTKCKNYKIGDIYFDENIKISVDEVSVDDVEFDGSGHYFDLDSIPSGAVFRHRQNGDIFRRFGSGEKTLSNYLTNKKLPMIDRDKLIVLANENNVLLVIGDDISDQIKITDGTTRFGKISVTYKNC